MSTLSVSNITSPTNTTPLVLSSANDQAAFIRVEATNNDIVFGGTTRFLGTFSASFLQSNSINVAFDVANASFNIANTVSGDLVSASYNTANAAFNFANNLSVSSGDPTFAFRHANSAFDKANDTFIITGNVSAQTTSSYRNANAAFRHANSVYAFANSISASINSNWAVTNTVYGVANTALPNISSPTLAGTLTVSTAGVPQVINSTNGNTYKVALRDNGTTVGFLGGSSSTPFIVANSAVNSLFSVDNIGNFAVTGNISSVGSITTSGITTGNIAAGNVTASGTLSTSSRGITKESMPAGSILQVQSTSLTSTFTTSSTSWTDLTGMSVSITPTSATSKILIDVCLCFIGDAATQGYCRIDRNGTAIGIGDANGSRVRFSLNNYINQENEVRTSSLSFLDSPANTSPLTYKLQLQSQGTGTVYVNRSTTWADGQTSGTGISTITVYEIAQ